MRNLRHVALVSALLIISNVKVYAIGAIDYSIHQEYTSSRALGMGNAFAAVVDDHSTLFYNPAALAFRENGNLRMFVRAGLDPQYTEFASDLGEASGASSEIEQINAINNVLDDYLGVNMHSRVPTLGAVWVRPNWGIAFIPADVSTDIAPHQNGGYSLSINAYIDTTLAYGYAKKFTWKDHQFAIGGTVKGIHRIDSSKQVLSLELVSDSEAAFSNNDAREGLTFDVDIGTLFVPEVSKGSVFRFAKPTMAVVVRNLLDIGFPMDLDLIGSESEEEPRQLYRRIDIGTKLELPKFWVFQPKFAFDVRDILHPNYSTQKGLHAGFELFWKVKEWWKGYWSFGSNQGYYTFGFGSRFGVFQLDLTTWGEEVGTSSVPQESRRYMVETSLDF